MRYLGLFLIIFVKTSGFAQSTTFEFLFENEQSQFTVFACETNDGDYLITSFQDTSTVILQLDETGILTDSIELKITNFDIGINYIHEKEEEYLLFGFASRMDNDSTYRLIGIIDKDLTQFEYELVPLSNSLFFSEECKEVGQEIFCVGTTYIGSVARQPFFFDITCQLMSIS